MARADQGPIETFMSITGASQAVAVQKLQDCGGDLNEAVNSYFTEGDRNITRQAPVPASENDFMAIDDDPIQVESQGPSLPLLSAAANLNPFSLLDSRFRRSFFEGRGPPEFASETPYVTHPREVREIPIEVKDENGQSSRSGSGPTVEDVTGTACAGPEIRGAVIIDDDEEDEIMPTVTTRSRSFGQNERGVFSGHSLRERNLVPSAPGIDNVNDYGNDIEEEMIRAAIEASKREVSDDMLNQQIEATTNDSSGPALPQRQSHGEDAELARAVSLSIQTAEREKALREQGGLLENAEKGALNSSDVEEVGKITVTSGRQGIGSFGLRTSGQPYMEAGGSSFQDEAEDAEEQPLVRQRSRRVSFGSDSGKEGSEMEDSPPSSPAPRDNNRPQLNGNVLPTDEWGGISSEEHDEAVMLEAALFGGIPEGTAYRFGYPPQQPMPMGPDRDFYPHVPRPPSPNLTAQRLLREQQDDEYLASLQADREKELKAMEEAEARRLTEQAAKDAALEEERKREEETRQKLLEEEELERQLAAKEASLPQEPTSDDESSVTLLVRMPDGSRRGRRFLKSDNLQSLFDFIDVGRAVKPGTYRLVRPYPRRTFSDGDSKLSLSDLGLTSKQEALFLELI